MKKLLLLLSLVHFGQANAQTVTIPDANFVTYLQSIIPTAMSGNQMDTTNALVTTTTHSIIVSSKSISNLFGSQFFTSLTYLDCSQNSLTGLPSLPNTLQYLFCTHNSLNSLPTLPNSLLTIDCRWNNLTSISSFPNSLTWGACDFNFLTNLPMLPSSLQNFSCGDNSITNLPNLPSSLTWFACNNNNIACFPLFPSSIGTLYIDPNPYNCLPNHISAMNSTDLAKPICAAGNSNGCTVTDIEQLMSNISLSIYPNPTSDQFFIETNATDKLTVDLYDVNGRHVFSKSVSDKSNIDMTTFDDGIYTLTIKTADRIINKKLVIVH